MQQKPDDRRHFLAQGALSMGLLGTGAALSPTNSLQAHELAKDEKAQAEHYRYHPGPGGPVGTGLDRGKLIPGLRKPGQAPVRITAPDLEKLPWKRVNGAKEFHLHSMQVRREFLPGNAMVVWGFNGSMPGPTIEVDQGDRVRIVVHNDLPEPTSMHWHGLELPIQWDGVPGLTQEFIPPGKTKAYEFDLHQDGTFFYHAHVPMQEAMGQVGFFIIHPKVDYSPVVDRDFALCFQNFHIPPNQVINDSMAMDWNWHTINGRSGPYTTPLVVKHGERVRVRLLNFSPMQHHPIHLHGHTFWLTGTEGGRIPSEAWIPANVTLTGVAMVRVFELVANNPGDWIFHCHMVHHMMNHMVKQVGPRIRPDSDVTQYQQDLDSRPEVRSSLEKDKFDVPGYPQKMQGMKMSEAAMKKIWGRREVQGMRHNWFMGVHGLMTVLRVLPEDLYKRVMESREKIAKGAIYDEVVRRTDQYFSNPRQ